MSNSSRIKPKRYNRRMADLFARHNAYRIIQENHQISKILSKKEELHRMEVSRLKKIIKDFKKQISNLQKALDLERRLLSKREKHNI